MQVMAQGLQGGVTSPHQLASESGLRVLQAGGNAIDAMLAASATLSVVFPHMTGIGGDAIWLLFDGNVRTLTGIGQSGQRLPDSGQISTRGPSSVATTAGAIASWELARSISQHQWGSSFTLKDLFEDAIFCAEKGSPVSQSQAFWQAQRADLIKTLPGLFPLTHNTQTQLLAAGDTLLQPELGATFARLSKAGLRDFYEGEIAYELAQGFATLACGLSLKDLNKTRAMEVEPASVRYRQGTLYNFPPPNQGIYTLQGLACYASLAPTGLDNGSAQYYHLLVEAIKQGLIRRNQELCDPVVTQWDYKQTLTDAAIAEYATQISPQRCSTWSEIGQPADTVWLAATDKQGRTACLMQSLFHDFGSGCVVGNTGVLWQNRAAGFNADANHVNAWAPNKRPAHTLNPSAYIADDGTQKFFGSQGGDGQPQTQMVLATQLIDFDKNPDDALLAPRFLQGRSFFESTENLKIEESVPQDVIEQLKHLGHDIEIIPNLSPYTGQAGVITIDQDGVRRCAHDPRGEGVSLAQ